ERSAAEREQQVVVGLVFEAPDAARDVGAVDEDVDAAERVDRTVDGGLHLFAHEHVGRHELRPGAELLGQLLGDLRAGLGVDLGDGHRVALTGVPPGDATPDALAGAGHERHPSIEPSHVLPPSPARRRGPVAGRPRLSRSPDRGPRSSGSDDGRGSGQARNRRPYAARKTVTAPRAWRSRSAGASGPSRPSSIASFNAADMRSQLNWAAASNGSSRCTTLRAASRSNVVASAAIVRPGPRS